jgi:hypothetical protein
MPETGIGAGSIAVWLAIGAAVLVLLVGGVFWAKGRRRPGPHVFRASRFSRGNFLLPAQVLVTPTSVVHYTPELVGGREQSMHLAHVASVLVDRNLFFSDLMIESSGGASPVRCYGHRKADALEIKRLIEHYQSEYYRNRGDNVVRDGRRAP